MALAGETETVTDREEGGLPDGGVVAGMELLQAVRKGDKASREKNLREHMVKRVCSGHDHAATGPWARKGAGKDRGARKG